MDTRLRGHDGAGWRRVDGWHDGYRPGTRSPVRVTPASEVGAFWPDGPTQDSPGQRPGKSFTPIIAALKGQNRHLNPRMIPDTGVFDSAMHPRSTRTTKAESGSRGFIVPVDKNTRRLPPQKGVASCMHVSPLQGLRFFFIPVPRALPRAILRYPFGVLDRQPNLEVPVIRCPHLPTLYSRAQS